MTINDKPIHLAELEICKREPHSEPSVNVPVWITQSSLDGLQALIQFCNGAEHSGGGRVPGSFELIMFYRTLGSCIRKANAEATGEKYV